CAIHDFVAQELRAAFEELLERLLPVLRVEHILLLHRDPRKLAALFLGSASQLGVLGLELRELLASSPPVPPGSSLVLGHSSPPSSGCQRCRPERAAELIARASPRRLGGRTISKPSGRR